MKRKLILGAVLALCCGCSSMNNTESGALGGGLIGGILGTGIGLACHNPAAGAIIGAGTGAAIGGLAGASEDRHEEKVKEQQAVAVAAAQQAQVNAPRLDEIVQMTKNGVRDDLIITQIRNSRAVYKLNPDDLSYLSANGVSPSVINELQNSARQVYVSSPQPVVLVRPGYYDPYYYPAPVAVGFYGGRRW